MNNDRIYNHGQVRFNLWGAALASLMLTTSGCAQEADRADDYDEVDDLSSKTLSTNGVVSLCLIFIRFPWPLCRYNIGVMFNNAITAG